MIGPGSFFSSLFLIEDIVKVNIYTYLVVGRT